MPGEVLAQGGEAALELLLELGDLALDGVGEVGVELPHVAKLLVAVPHQPAHGLASRGKLEVVAGRAARRSRVPRSRA